MLIMQCRKSLPLSSRASSGITYGKAANIAARKQYYNQNPDLIRYVLSKPPDRVKYTNLRVVRKDFEEIEKYGKEAGIFNGKTHFDEYADPSFVAEERGIEAWQWEMTK